MNIAFFLTLAVFSALLTLSAVAQLLYVESLRLRSRNLPRLSTSRKTWKIALD